jgi:hypothetical protein
MSAHPGWTAALKKAGTFGANEGYSALMQPQVPEPPPPPPEPTPMLPGFGGGQGMDELSAAQLARLRAYFMPTQYGRGGEMQ